MVGLLVDPVKEWGYFIEGIGFVGLLSDVQVWEAEQSAGDLVCVFFFLEDRLNVESTQMPRAKKSWRTIFKEIFEPYQNLSRWHAK